MKFSIPNDQFGQIIYLPKNIVPYHPYLLKTGQVYNGNLYDNEVCKLFSKIAKKEYTKQVILTSSAGGDPWVLKVTNTQNPNGWQFYRNINVEDPWYGKYSPKGMENMTWNFTFSDNCLYSVYQWGPSTSTPIPYPQVLEGLFPNTTDWIVLDQAANMLGKRTISTHYQQGFTSIRVRNISWENYSTAGLYLSLAPSKYYDFYVPQAPEMKGFESYICIKHTNLADKFYL